MLCLPSSDAAPSASFVQRPSGLLQVGSRVPTSTPGMVEFRFSACSLWKLLAPSQWLRASSVEETQTRPRSSSSNSTTRQGLVARARSLGTWSLGTLGDVSSNPACHWS